MYIKVFILLLFLPPFLTEMKNHEGQISYNKYQILALRGMDVFHSEEEVLRHFDILLDDEDVQILDGDRDEVHLLVSPRAISNMIERIHRDQFDYEVLNEDVGSTLQAETVLRSETPPLNGSSTFERYMNLDEINAYMDSMAREFPSLVETVDIGTTFEKRAIKMAVISEQTEMTEKKPVVFVEGGIHAREWISPASAIFLVDNLIHSPWLTKDIEWRIVPVSNPDGYLHTWTSDRLWRKNRRTPPSYTKKKKNRRQCFGVDLNRNFDAFWNKGGASSLPCSGVYLGTEPFSEPETDAIRKAVEEVQSRLKAYVSVHSYGQLILYPPGIRSADISHVTMKKVAKLMSAAIKNDTSAVYKIGSPPEILYSASGLSMDWAALKANAPFSYTFEMRDKGHYGFILHADEIFKTVNDLWSGVQILAQEMMKEETDPTSEEVSEDPTTEGVSEDTETPSPIETISGETEIPLF